MVRSTHNARNSTARGVRLTQQILLHYGRNRNARESVAYCPELDLSSCGRDVDEARANLKTAVRLFTGEAARMGTLDQVLQEAGYPVCR